jgi:hypothetical protein
MKKLFFAIAILFSISVKAYNVSDTLRPESTPPIGVKTNKSQKAAPLRAKNITPKNIAGRVIATKAMINIVNPDNYDSTFTMVTTLYGSDSVSNKTYEIKLVDTYKGTVLGSYPPTVQQQEAKAASAYGLNFLN